MDDESHVPMTSGVLLERCGTDAAAGVPAEPYSDEPHLWYAHALSDDAAALRNPKAVAILLFGFVARETSPAFEES